MERYLLKDFPHMDNLSLGISSIRMGKHGDMLFHDHDFSEIVLILNTEKTYHLVGKKKYELSRGDVLLLHPGILHAYENTSKLKLINLIYDSRKLFLPTLDANHLTLFHHINHPDTARLIPAELPVAHLNEKKLNEVCRNIRLLNAELNSHEPGKHMMAFALFLEIITEIARHGSKNSSFSGFSLAEPALNYINTHVNEEITVAKLARIAHLSERSLFYHFKALTGMPPLQYRRKKQLELAEYFLKNTAYTLAEIASKCGFCDSNHLTREFSANFRIPPARFRRKKYDADSRTQ